MSLLVPLYEDPNFWSVVIAALALILTQLPPISILLRRSKVNIFVLHQIVMYHFIGNININLSLDIRNVGGRTVSIDKIDVIIVDEKKNVFHLPAKTYISKQPPSPGMPQFELILPRISLRSGENWSELIKCYRFWTKEEYEEVHIIISDIRDDILSKKLVDEDHNRKAISLFNKTFKIREGDYRLLIAAISEHDSILDVVGFDFTLCDSDIRILRESTERYKLGIGLYFPIDPNNSVLIQLNAIKDDNIKKLYENLRE